MRLALLTGLAHLSCASAKSASSSLLSSLHYQARERLRQLLFREDLSLLSNEEIERILYLAQDNASQISGAGRSAANS